MHLAALYLCMYGDSEGNETSSCKWYAFASRKLQRDVSFYTTFSRGSATLKLIQIYFI